ncbi:hypothetical protein [Actinomadura sp. 21ATH]|uniref:hypothetical protein n=1 Tax=Actinomadura sp. 21ATH TaxID=1735444 RepID=UPI0035C0BA16
METRVDSNSYLTEEQKQVYQLRSSLERNGGTPVGFLELLAAVVDQDTWRKIPSGVNREDPFDDFADFIEAKPPFGLNSTVEHVRVLLRLHHPHEGVPHIAEQMQHMRARLAQLLGPDPCQNPIDRDARAFGAFTESGGWVFALMVARSARKGGGGPRPGKPVSKAHDQNRRPPDNTDGKVSFTTFAQRAGCDVGRVSRYHKAWERAAHDGVVPHADTLVPGQQIALPGPDRWSAYFTVYEPSSDTRQQLAAQAEAIGTSYSKAVQITANRPALRAAILGDRQTAEAARDALLERPQERAAMVARVLQEDPAVRKQAAAHTRRAERLDYLQRVVAQGRAKTPAGHEVDLDPAVRQQAAQYLTACQDPQSDPHTLDHACEFVSDSVRAAVQADPDTFLREQRTKLGKALSGTVRSIEAIDPDDLIACADSSLITSVAELQKKVNALATLIARLADDANTGPRG